MSTELSTQTQSRGLALQTFDDAWRFWQMVAKTDFAPKDFKGKPEACLLAGQHGAELGLGPMQSLQCIAVINGRPSIWGDAALALVQSSPVCEFVCEEVTGDGDAMVAHCQAKRRGYPKPTTVQFSVADAKKAGLWGKAGPWSQYPRRMLQLRARGFALRDAFPDVLKGLVTAEEAQDYQTPAVTDHGPAGGAYAGFVRNSEPVVVRPKFDEPAPARDGRVVLSPKRPPPAAPDSHEARARLAISAATSMDGLDALRRLIEERRAEGVFTDDQAKELSGMCLERASMLPQEVQA